MLENINLNANNIKNINNNTNRPQTTQPEENLIPFDMLDPTRVNKTLKDENSSFNNQDNISKNPFSILEKFLTTLDSAPSLTDNMSKILFNKNFINSNIKSNPLLKTFFEEFVKGIVMDKQKMIEYLKFQQNSYTKYKGEFFNFLRQCIDKDSNTDIKFITSNFLKSYDCFISIDDNLKSITDILKNINKHMPEILKPTFKSLIDKLIFDDPNENMDINLKTLKNEIIPYLGKYISKTNDFGIIRDYISVLIHNIIRLETGTKENFTNNVDTLINYLKSSYNLGEEEISKLKYTLISTFKNHSELKDNNLDYMFKLIEKGINDTNNDNVKTTFNNINNSLLSANHVQIPLVHLFIPAVLNGVFMFSEIWIDKEIINDTDKDSSKKDKDSTSEQYKLFVTFELESLGYFETIIYFKNKDISLELSVPKIFKYNEDKIKKDIKNIIEKNGINIVNIFVNECKDHRKISNVFGSKLIKECGINVIA